MYFFLLQFSFNFSLYYFSFCLIEYVILLTVLIVRNNIYLLEETEKLVYGRILKLYNDSNCIFYPL